jgi:hypothetical protein
MIIVCFVLNINCTNIYTNLPVVDEKLLAEIRQSLTHFSHDNKKASFLRPQSHKIEIINIRLVIY